MSRAVFGSPSLQTSRQEVSIPMDRLSPVSTSTSLESGSPVSGEPLVDKNAEALMNLSLLDPPHWGWSAAGGVVDLLPPHERARRKETKDAYLEELQRQAKMEKKLQISQKPRSRPTWGSPTNPPLHSPSQCATRLDVSINNSITEINEREKVTNSDLKDKDSSVHTIPHNETMKKDTPEKSADDLDMKKRVGPSSPPDLLAVETSDNNLQRSNVQTETVGPLSSQAPSKPDTPEEVFNDINVSNDTDTKDAGSRKDSSGDKSEKKEIDGKNLQKKIKKKDEGVLEVQALSETGVLDMYSYHRGREGMEPRDNHTGELLCDVCETDTNHRWDKPRMMAMVNVSFPISDTLDSNDELGDIEGAARTQRRKQYAGCSPESNLSKGKKDKEHGPYFRETIEWDLSDPSTPSAMTFAANVALEFGLEYGQTMDLAASIQKQIDEFVRSNISYDPPLALTDPYGNEREAGKLVPPGFGSTPTLYGEFNCPGRPGFRRISSGGRPRAKSSATVIRRSSSKPISHEPLPAHLLPKHDGPTPVIAKSGRSSGKSFDFQIEKKYRDEILKRVKAASINEIRQISESERDDGLVGVISRASNHVCHICHARKPHCAVFSCTKHSFCEYHCTTRLGFSVVKPEKFPILLEHCPICCLECVCPKCCRRLDDVAGLLKSKSKDKGTNLEETDIGDILRLCSGNSKLGASSTRPQSKDLGKRESSGRVTGRESVSASGVEREKSKPTRKAAKVDIEKPALVEKVPISDFPREVSGGRDLDPLSADEYRTMFTDKGNYLIPDKSKDVKTSKDTPAAESKEDVSVDVEEDGNVDYCHICRKHGNLLCCDRCPRAFHRECVDSSGIPDKDWECNVCKNEKAGLPDDKVNGEKSMDAISATLVEYNFSDGFVASAQILSMIHEMVLKLMDYEFGNLFRVPVDCDAVRGYKALVKCPMDLGTIAAKLMNGDYAKRFHMRQSWDDVLIAVLQDIELVWHNCFTFNCEGSAIYRMAEVHRRRSNNIQMVSFYSLLSDNVKNCVKEYVAARCKERGISVAPVQFNTSSDEPQTGSEVGQNNKKAKSRHKFSVPTSSGGASRQVAVLDPSTGMLVKVYNSMKGAGKAALCLSELGHKSEYAPITDAVVNNIIRRSSKDPSLLLFGYRWLYLDDLRDRKVKYAKNQAPVDTKRTNIRKGRRSSSIFVEMMDEGNKFVFISIEEALSNPWLADGPVTELKRLLLVRPPGEEFDFMGRTWRILLPKCGNKKKSEKETHNTSVGIDLNPILINGLPSSKGCFRHDILEQSFPPDVTFVKEDAISGRKLLGFQNINGAHKDWLVTRESCPGFAKDIPSDLDYFKSNYLDNSLNIDGVFWKTIPKLSFEPQAQNTRGLTAQNGMSTTSHCDSKTDRPESSSNETEIARTFKEPKGGTTCITPGSTISTLKIKGPPSSEQRTKNLAALYKNRSVNWDAGRIHTTAKTAREDRAQLGVKRTRNDDTTIDENARVTKKMAVTGA